MRGQTDCSTDTLHRRRNNRIRLWTNRAATTSVTKRIPIVALTRSRLELSEPAIATPQAARIASVPEVTTSRARIAQPARISSEPRFRYWRYVNIVATIDPVGSEFVIAKFARVTLVIHPRGALTPPAASNSCCTNAYETIDRNSRTTARTSHSHRMWVR